MARACSSSQAVPGWTGLRFRAKGSSLKVDIADGRVTHLATLEVEDTAKYGPAHLEISSQYHADYAPLADTLVYYDMTGHNMYLLGLDTGRRERILHEPEGTIGDPPSISPDGTRVVTAFPGQKGPRYAEHEKDQVHINHCQINPANKDHTSYAHEFHGFGVDGSLLKTRCWQVMADGSGNRPTSGGQRVGEGHTHEVFGPKGESLYYVDFSHRSVCAVDCATGEHGNPMSSILLVDTQTGRQEVLCRFPREQAFPMDHCPSLNLPRAPVVIRIVRISSRSHLCLCARRRASSAGRASS